MEKRELLIWKIYFISGFFLYGLFKEYGPCLYAGLGGCILLCRLRRRGLRVYGNLESLTVLAVFCASLLTCIYGVDRGMSLIGAIRMLSAVFFLLTAMQLEEGQRKEALAWIPWAGAAMTGIGLVSWPIAPLKELFWVSDRLGGFFQYPNTYALFCLVGLILLSARVKEGGNRRDWAGIVLLLAGILFSGSRTVFLLLILAAAVMAVLWKKARLPIVGIGLAAAVLVLGYALYSGNLQNIARFLTISLKSSTLLGRIIYVQDGLSLLARHPFGLGYLGYYYMEPAIQTADYSVRYIHNDYLQTALDYGVIPCVLMLAVLIRNLLSRRNSPENRLAILVMALHFFLDFDLEFLSVLFLLLLLTDYGHGKEWTLKSGKKAVFFGIEAAGALYVGAALLPYYLGNPSLTYRLLPFHTESGVSVLAAETDAQKAGELAEKLGKQNSYLRDVYDVQAVLAYQDGDYDGLIEAKKKSVNLSRYDMEAYENYVILLSYAVTNAEQDGDAEGMQKLLAAAVEIPELIAETEEATNPLAYDTRDAPDFTLSDEVQDYISQAQEYLANQ